MPRAVDDLAGQERFDKEAPPVLGGAVRSETDNALPGELAAEHPFLTTFGAQRMRTNSRSNPS